MSILSWIKNLFTKKYSQIYVSFNQLKTSEFSLALQMKLDGAWIVPSNSQWITAQMWQELGRKSKRVVIEQGANDRNWLFDKTWPSPAPVITREVTLYGKSSNYVCVYHEDSTAPLPFDKPTLLPSDIPTAYQALKRPLIILFRRYDLTTLAETITRPEVMGGAFEFGPDINQVRKQLIHKWIEYIVSLKKTPFLLIPALPDSVDYENDVLQSLQYIKDKSSNFSKVRIVLAIYEREKTGAKFFGKTNSVEAAIKLLKSNFFIA